MPDEAIEQAAEHVEAARAAIEQASEPDRSIGEIRAALERATARLDAAEATLAELVEQVTGLAPRDHAHPTSPGMTRLADALAEMEAEEQAPKRTHPLRRPLWGDTSA